MCRLVPKPIYAILRNWTRHIFFLSKLLQWNLETLINIGNALQCSKYGACSLKSKGYREWRTGPRFRYHTASMGSYETAAILFSDIESNWKLWMLLGIPNAISMQNCSSISRTYRVFSYMYSIGLRSGHQCAHLGNVQAGAQATICYTTQLNQTQLLFS